MSGRGMIRPFFFTALAAASLAACGPPPPPVEASREVLWQQYGHQSIDKLLLSWGAPIQETHLTDGSRMVTYKHMTIFEADSPYERRSGCEVNFLAPPPKFLIENISMEGDMRECQLLSQGRRGYTRYVYVPQPSPYYSRLPY